MLTCSCFFCALQWSRQIKHSQLEDEYPDLVLAHACQVDIFLGSADGSLHLAYSHYFDDGKCRFVPTVWDWDSDADVVEQVFLHVPSSFALPSRPAT